MKKRLLTTVFVGIFMLVITTSAFATTIGWSPSESWNSKTKDFSPSWGNTSFYGYEDQFGDFYVEPKCRWNFTDADKNAVWNRYINYKEYYGFDIAVQDDYNTTVNGMYDHYTNLPNPKFDLEDDGGLGGNGYIEEIEVTSASPLDINASIDYRFDGKFVVYNTSSIQFGFTSQSSKLSITGEYNTMDYEIHRYRWYPW